jgi:predicted transcriptional regulator
MTKRTEQVNIRLDPETKAELAAIAQSQHRTVSNLILVVLKDWLAAYRGSDQTKGK